MDSNKQRVQEILKQLRKAYPDAPETYLNHGNAFEMLIATILSANTADACVNTITPELFHRYPNAEHLMRASLEDIIGIIRPCGTYNRKSSYIRDSARLISEKFGGKVPKSMEDLVALPGVSRKTANVVLSVIFKVKEGVVVDTHVMRVTQRLGLTQHQKNREKAERDLMALLPQEQWYEYAKLVGAHGRRTCNARKPECDACAVKYLCPSADKFT
ncbi:MAG: endonuclease III [Candidatus Thorarchaeota archaeon]